MLRLPMHFLQRLPLCTFLDFRQAGKDISLLIWPVIPLRPTRVEVFLAFLADFHFLSPFRFPFC